MKKHLREDIKHKFAIFTDEELKEKSKKIINKLSKVKQFSQAENIFIYMSFDKEVFTFDLIQELLKQWKNVIVPKIIWDEIIPISVCSIEQFSKWAFWILEPCNDKSYDWPIDIAIIPGLWFCQDGKRLWRWKWYYDRFLADKQIFKIGLAYDFQLCEHIPTQVHDIDMDLVIY